MQCLSSFHPSAVVNGECVCICLSLPNAIKLEPGLCCTTTQNWINSEGFWKNVLMQGCICCSIRNKIAPTTCIGVGLYSCAHERTLPQSNHNVSCNIIKLNKHSNCCVGLRGTNLARHDATRHWFRMYRVQEKARVCSYSAVLFV